MCYGFILEKKQNNKNLLSEIFGRNPGSTTYGSAVGRTIASLSFLFHKMEKTLRVRQC